MERKYSLLPDFVLDLLAGKASRSLTPAQEERLQEWLSENPLQVSAASELLELLQKQTYLHLRDQVSLPKGWEIVRQKINLKNPIRSLAWKWSKIAAVILALAGFAWFLHTIMPKSPTEEVVAQSSSVERNNKAILILSDGNRLILDNPGDTLLKETGGIHIRNKPGELLSYDQTSSGFSENTFNKLMVPEGTRYQLQLSDGTKIWVNAASLLEYPVSFGQSVRKVKLTGEAFFEVASDVTRPFIIDANGYEIKILGTSFNVSAYPTDNYMETTLVSGAVEIAGGGERIASLSPSQMARISSMNHSVEIQTVDTRYYTSWKDGILYFDNLSLEELAIRLERWYGVEIIFTTEKQKRLHFSGAMENSRNIRFLLNLISQTTHVKFIINEKTITVE